jgi:hypothetical protein
MNRVPLGKGSTLKKTKKGRAVTACETLSTALTILTVHDKNAPPVKDKNAKRS